MDASDFMNIMTLAQTINASTSNPVPTSHGFDIPQWIIIGITLVYILNLLNRHD